MENQCVCITGSTHGIGYGIAKAFAPLRMVYSPVKSNFPWL